MGRKKRERLEFRFYEIPAGESALALFGEQWTGTYGHTDICMHFHNLFEIGYCHRGRGLLVLGEKEHVYEDGLNEFGIFFRIYMPVMKSTYAAAAVITFMNAWNAYLWPRVVLKAPEAQTMPLFIANLAGGYTIDYGALMMSVLFCSLPTVIIFFILQKQFAEGITGAVK